MEENPEATVYAVFYRVDGGPWNFHGSCNRHQSSFYASKPTAKGIATRETNQRPRIKVSRDPEVFLNYEYKVMQLTGEWADID